MDDTVLALKGISVRYGDVAALTNVDFNLRRGEIHALVGEHRAGKSTLVHVISGAIQRTSGELFLDGRSVPTISPRTAIARGIATVYQDVNIVGTLTAPEFIFTGRMKTKAWGWLDRHAMERETVELLARYGIEIDVTLPMAELPEDKRLMVELVKALSVDPRIIIFDEISSKLTPDEMETVFAILDEYKRAGKSVIYISHNLDEIFEIADRVTVLKDGRRLGTEEIKDLDRIKLIKMTYSYVMTREELNQSNKELYYFTKYNEAIIRNIPIGVIILDENNNVYLINFAALKITQMGEFEGAGMPMERLFDAERIPVAEEIFACIRDRTESTWEDVADGYGGLLRINNYPFRDEDYTFLGTIILVQDVSRERYFEDYLLRTEKISSVAELAAGVAHEINNPIGICLNYVELLDRRITDPYSVEKIGKVRSELNRIAEVIESLLSFSRINRNVWDNVNVRDIVDETILLVEHLARQKQIEFVVNDGGGAPVVYGDENQLKQVFVNLLKNSIESILDTGTITITIDAPDPGAVVEVAVVDDGCGISGEFLPHVFDPFVTTKITKQNTGLGLSICQHIVENHDGIIECTSDAGTTMTLRLPRVQ